MKTSEDGYLLQKVIPKDTITRTIDWRELGITKEYVNEQAKLNKKDKPNLDDEKATDKYFITEMCLPYNPMPDDRDEFVYYNDIRALSGSAGYLRIRDGYVWGHKVVWRS